MDALRRQSLDTDASLVMSWLLQHMMKMKASPESWWHVVQPQHRVEQKTHSLGKQTSHPMQLSLEVGQLLHVAPNAHSLQLVEQTFVDIEIPSESWHPLLQHP